MFESISFRGFCWGPRAGVDSGPLPVSLVVSSSCPGGCLCTTHYRAGQALRGNEVEGPRLQDKRHMMVVSLSALRTGRFYPPGKIPGTHFCYRLSRPQGRSAVGRIMSMKNSSDTIGNRTRDLLA